MPVSEQAQSHPCYAFVVSVFQRLLEISLPHEKYNIQPVQILMSDETP